MVRNGALVLGTALLLLLGTVHGMNDPVDREFKRVMDVIKSDIPDDDPPRFETDEPHRPLGVLHEGVAASALKRESMREDMSCVGIRVRIASITLPVKFFKTKAGRRANFKKVTVECRAARQAIGLKDNKPSCLNDFVEKPLVAAVSEKHAQVFGENVIFAVPAKGVDYDWIKGGVIADLDFPDTAGRPAVQCVIKRRRKVLGVFRVTHESVLNKNDFGEFVSDTYSSRPSDRERVSTASTPRRIALRDWFRDRKVKGDTVDWVTGYDVGRVEGSYICDKMVARSSLAHDRALSLTERVHVRDFTNPESFWSKNRECPLVVAHRSVVGEYDQENSLGALQATERAGIPGTEVDVLPSSRGPVVSHDKTLARQLGIDVSVEDVAADPTGNFVSKLEEATNCEVLTKLDTFFAAVDETDLLVDLDLKPVMPSVLPRAKIRARDFGFEVRKLVKKHQLESRVVISAMDPEKLVPFGGYLGNIRVANVRHTGLGKVVSFVGSAMGTMKKHIHRTVPRAQVMHYKLVTPEIVEKAHERHEPVGVYTLFKADELGMEYQPSHDVKKVEEIIAMGVDWIETDDPVKLRSIVYEKCVANAQILRAARSMREREVRSK